MNLWDLLAQCPGRLNERPLIISDGKAFAYSRFHSRCLQTASFFRSIGIQKGTPVAVCLPTSHYYTEIFFGLARLGAVIVAIKPPANGDELKYYMRMGQASYLVVGDTLYDQIRDTLAQVPGLLAHIVIRFRDGASSYEEILSGMEADALSVCSLASEDPAMVCFTSGSMGVPKAVTVSCGELFWELGHMPPAPEGKPEPTLLMCTSLSQLSAWAQLLRALQRGMQIVLLPQSNPETLVQTLGRHRATHCYVTPKLLMQLLRKPELVHAPCWEHLEEFRFGYDETPPEFKKKARQLLPGHIRLQEIYGTVEAFFAITRLELSQVSPEKLGSVGRPLAGKRVSIRSAEGQELPAGQVGSVYFYKESRSRWICTDDRGYVDEDGYLYLSGLNLSGSGRGTSFGIQKIFPLIPQAAMLHQSSQTIPLDMANALASILFCRTREELLRSVFLVGSRFLSAAYYGFQLPDPGRRSNIFTDDYLETHAKWDFSIDERMKLHISPRPTAANLKQEQFWDTYDSLYVFLVQDQPAHTAMLPLVYDDSSQLGALYFFRYDRSFTPEEQKLIQHLGTNVSAALFHLSQQQKQLDTLQFHAQVDQKASLSFLFLDLSGNILYENYRSRRGRELLDEGELPAYLRALRKNVRNITVNSFPESVARYTSRWNRRTTVFLLHSYLTRDGKHIMTIVKEEKAANRESSLLSGLTPREQEIIQHLRTGKNTGTIAADLCVSENTIKVHVQRIYQKLNVRSRGELLALLYQNPEET